MNTLRAFALAILAAMLAGAAPPVDPNGVWRNPNNSLHVKVFSCADKVCGVIVWASAYSLQDAKESGIKEPLVGTQLLIDYRRTGPGSWKGRVYVPDMGGTFYSRIVAQGPNTLDISGCIIGGLICKHQAWQRIQS